MNTTIQNNTKYKNSPLGLIPEDWEVKKFGEIAIVKGRIGYRGYTVNDIVNQGEGAITISPSNIFDNSINFMSNTYISWYKYDESPEIQIQINDILLVKTGSTFGKTAIVKLLPEKATINPQLVVIKNVKSNELYLSYLMSGALFQKQINKTVVGGAIPTLSQENILNFIIPIPSLPEQKAIADCLSTWDKAIEKLNALIAQKERSKKTLMQQLLSGKKRLKGFVEQWKEYHLKDMFLERNETGYLDLTLLSVGATGIYPQSEAVKKDSSNEDKSKYKRICMDDIGYNTMRMWQGRSALSSLEGIVSPAYTVLKPRENTYSLYFSYLFKTPKLMNLFWRNSQGLVDDTLNCKYKDFARIKYFLPEIKEQTAIANVLQCADNDLQLLKKKLYQLKEQKKGLMQVLLTGKKRLNF